MRGQRFRRYCASVALSLAAGALLAATVYAQENFPGGKPIEMTVLFPAGTSADVTARVFAQIASEAWKQPVIADNRSGASGMLGLDALVAAAPDG